MNVVVLYEDSRAPDRKFAFHDLVVRAVLDRRGDSEATSWTYAGRVKADPRNGNGNVLREFENRDRLESLLSRGRVVAVFDSDKIMKLVPVGVAACKSSVTAWLSERAAVANSVKVVLLERNLETIVAAIQEADRHLVSDDEFRRAAGKDRIARDTILRKAASRSDVRQALRDSVPSFAYLVDHIAERLA